MLELGNSRVFGQAFQPIDFEFGCRRLDDAVPPKTTMVPRMPNSSKVNSGFKNSSSRRWAEFVPLQQIEVLIAAIAGVFHDAPDSLGSIRVFFTWLGALQGSALCVFEVKKNHYLRE